MVPFAGLRIAKELLKLLAAGFAVVLLILVLSHFGVRSGLSERILFFTAWAPLVCIIGAVIWRSWKTDGKGRDRILREIFREEVRKRKR